VLYDGALDFRSGGRLLKVGVRFLKAPKLYLYPVDCK